MTSWTMLPVCSASLTSDVRNLHAVLYELYKRPLIEEHTGAPKISRSASNSSFLVNLGKPHNLLYHPRIYRPRAPPVTVSIALTPIPTMLYALTTFLSTLLVGLDFRLLERFIAEPSIAIRGGPY